MGGCEVREFLWQFGFFLPLRTAWPGYCSHVSNNQVVLLDTTTVLDELGWKTYPLNGYFRLSEMNDPLEIGKKRYSKYRSHDFADIGNEVKLTNF
nr:ephrin type-A receptor 6-like isoform X3 [Cavia porcellus]